jgi:hypothetical protein
MYVCMYVCVCVCMCVYVCVCVCMCRISILGGSLITIAWRVLGLHNEPRTWTDYLNKRSKLRNMDIRIRYLEYKKFI